MQLEEPKLLTLAHGESMVHLASCTARLPLDCELLIICDTAQCIAQCPGSLGFHSWRLSRKAKRTLDWESRDIGSNMTAIFITL